MVKQKIPKKQASETPSLNEAKKRLRQLNARPIKGLGQHFLVDPGILHTITSAADLEVNDTVIEVGPGLGILTSELVKRSKKVMAVELDSKLADNLQCKFASSPQLSVINADILDIGIADFITTYAPDAHRPQGYKVIANLPYYIASPILRHFLEATLKPSIMVIMVQKEVAQSIIAEPGNMSLVGISVQLYGKPRIIKYVPPDCFHPRPKVDSAILRIDVYPQPILDIADFDKFFKIVKAGFSTPRKQIRNSLSIGHDLPIPDVVATLENAGISPQRRPQTLCLEEWRSLYEAFADRNI